MGYDIQGNGEAKLVGANVPAAIEAIKAAYAQKATTVRLPNLTDAASLARGAEKIISCFYVMLVPDGDGDIIFQPNEDRFRRVDDDQWFFEAIAKFLDDSQFEFQGEDGLQWRWEFGPEGFKDVESHLVWGRDKKAPHIAGEVEDIIYDSATGKIRIHDDPQAALDQIEEILRKNGFGPFAGLDTLDALVKAAE